MFQFNLFNYDLTFNFSDLKDYNCSNLEIVSEAYEDIYESSEDEGLCLIILYFHSDGHFPSPGISMRRVVDEKCEVIISSEISGSNKGPR